MAPPATGIFGTKGETCSDALKVCFNGVCVYGVFIFGVFVCEVLVGVLNVLGHVTVILDVLTGVLMGVFVGGVRTV